MDYEEYERLCVARRKENKAYLAKFEKTLEEAGLSEKTINKHYSNVSFYLNEYLLREDAAAMKQGCYQIGDFLGNFFIRKCMWSTPSTIKSTAASLKKFYKCMKENGYVEAADYDVVVSTISDDMAFWIDDCEVFNDPSLDNPFSPF